MCSSDLNRFPTTEPQQVTCVEHCLANTEGPVIATLDALVRDGTIDAAMVAKAIEKYGIEAARENPWDH